MAGRPFPQTTTTRAFLPAAAMLMVLTAGGRAAPAAPRITPTGYAFSHHEWLAPQWGDPSGRTLTDGKADRQAHKVIFKGAVNVDFALPGRFRLKRVVVHAFRGNQWYLLDAVQVFAREQGTYVRIAQDTTGYRGEIKTSVYVYEFGGLDVVTDAVRVRVLTPNHCGLREVEFFGDPVAEEARTADAAPAPLSAGDELAAREGDVDGSGVRKVLLENRFVQLLVNPQRGGIVESVFHKPSGRQMSAVNADSAKFPGGLLEDHNWAPYYSYAEFPYVADLRTFPDRAVLTLTGRGRQEMYAFTEIVKTLTLHRGRASLDVTYEYKNDPSSMTDFDYSWWVHNMLAVAGEKNAFFMPTTRGVRRFDWAPDPKNRGRDDWVYKASRGWAGVLGESGAGVAVETELRLLHCFYTWAGADVATLEWRLAKLPVKSGESLETAVKFLFLNGLQELAGVGAGFAGSIRPAGKVVPDAEATFEAQLFSDRARSAEVVASAQRVAGGAPQVIGQGKAAFGPGETKRWTWSATLPAGTYRLLLSVTSGAARTTLERALTVGRPDRPYVQEPDVERIASAAASGGTPGELARHDLSLEVETPHEKWATPLPGGPIRAFILVDVGEQREIVELAQRVHLEVETVKIRSQLQGADYRYRGDRSIASLADAQDRILAALLKRKFDLLVIAGMDWTGHFTDAIRGAMIQQLRDGAGLVWIGPGGDEAVDEEGTGLLPVQGAAKRYWTVLRLPRSGFASAAAPAQSLARVIPLAEQLQILAYSHPETSGAVHMTADTITPRAGETPVLVTGGYGQARTVALTWDNIYNSGRPDRPGRLLPVFQGHRTIRKRDPSFRYWEDTYALLARVVVWAAGRDASVRLASAVVPPGEPKRLCVTFAGAPKGCTLRVSWQDEFGVEAATSTVAGQDGPTWEIPAPETVPAGPAHAYLFLRDAAGCALDWGAVAFEMSGPVRLVKIEQDRPFLPHGETAEAVAVVERRVGVSALRFEVLATDGCGRELNRDAVPVPEGDGGPVNVPLSCPTGAALGGQLRLDLALRDETRIHVKRTVTFGLTRILPARGPRLVVWDMTLGSKQKYINVLGARRALDLGMDAVLDGWHRTELPAYRAIVEGGVQYHPLNVLSIRDGQYHAKKEAYGKTRDKKHLVRRPCFDDPEDRARLIETFKEHCAPQLANGGALDYCLGDEMSLSHYADYFDYCFHPSTLAKFREWLRAEYKTLAALNAEWDTSYRDWAEAMPLTYDEAKAAKNPAPWADLRTYMEISLADFLAFVQKTLTELAPGSLISLSGTQSPVAGNGMDWWRMSRAVPLFHSYNTSNMCQARRCFSPWLCDEPWFAGYWQEDPKLEWKMWWCLFHNCSGVSGWYTPIFFYPDMTYTTSGRQMRDHWRELSGGLWQQVRALQVEKPKVAVHYSQASIHATFLSGASKAVHDAWNGWLRSLEDLTVSYDFVSYEQVENGELDRKQYRVLILPFSVALSDAEIAAVSRFVRAGNCVIADVCPGVTDQHCKPRTGDSVAELFGARRAGERPSDDAGLRFGDGLELARVRPAAALELTGGQAHGQATAGQVPVLVRNRVGAGRAALLNFQVRFYETERRLGQAPERAWRRLLGDLLAEAGVAPSATIELEGDALPHVEVVRYFDESGRLALVGLLNGLLPGAEERRVEVALADASAGLIYDLRAGRQVGPAPRLAAVLKPGEPKLYAVLPGPVEAEDAPAVVARPGELVEVAFAFTGLDLPQAVRCEVTDAAGKPRPEYGGVIVAPAGRGQIRLPLAVNDPKGAWKLRFRHILTGAASERDVEVR